MNSVLFLHSDVANPFELYKQRLADGTIHRDDASNTTAVYGYAECLALLHSPAAIIPPQNHDGLNEQALFISGGVARLRNHQDHAIAKKAASELHQRLQRVSAGPLLTHLLSHSPVYEQVDWVNQISKRLPVLSILKGFAFNDQDCESLANSMGSLVKIMQPVKPVETIAEINSVSCLCYQIMENHITDTVALYSVVDKISTEFACSKEHALQICTANLAGLMMQSYHACSGLLSITMLYALTQWKVINLLEKDGPAAVRKFVTELLRYDPPVHNTRRIAAENIMLHDTEIKKGENILLLLAAANRDEKKFKDADIFDINRSNNESQLTFGAGMHACVATEFATDMATQILIEFFTLFPNARLLTDRIQYEPIHNARLPVSLLISLH